MKKGDARAHSEIAEIAIGHAEAEVKESD